MTATYIAIDIGASSGRLMMGCLEDEKIKLEEVHRFKNTLYFEQEYHWDIHRLSQEILIGLEKVKKMGILNCFVGIDTWGVDYCLVDDQGQLIQNPICYRDERTKEAMDVVAKQMSLQAIYQKTGIQLQPFNTLFQLFVEDQKLLAKTDKILLIPDYLGFFFTGEAVLERTNASTTQLINQKTQELDPELLALTGTNLNQWGRLVDAGTILGELTTEKFSAFDLPKATFITVASHDTASAVIGTPGKGQDWAYISSGTWSLVGTEECQPIATNESQQQNYTNELGGYQTIRFLKNIMGMWLIQEVARNYDDQFSFAQLGEMAKTEIGFQTFIDVNASEFLKPNNMVEALQDYCQRTNQKVPATPGQLARCIYDNLALYYGKEIQQLQRQIGRDLTTIQIVGGGSNAELLNQLTADVTGLTIKAGPTEATAIGNIVVQMMTTKALINLVEARDLIANSFEISTYLPELNRAEIVSNYQDFLQEGNLVK
ncbi:rhamnulokinase [Carnobacterium gallinarum]|uniref:rhamnulokinase n=1 Tax=Carnobacterium gallinarum TaxID=2749 RepID=UPI000554B866|nr:rhamnulokinase [Carnobacterium gallinarum]